MKITENTILGSICGITSKITLGKFLSYAFKEDAIGNWYPDNYEVDEIIEFLNDDDGNANFEDCNFFNYSKGLCFTYESQADPDGILNVLEKVFGEKYLMMFSVRFYLPDVSNENFATIPFVEHEIESNENFEDLDTLGYGITKGHYENDTTKINDENFLSEDEKKQMKLYDDDEEVERYYDAKNCWYFIKKRDWNKEKWWKGWTCQGD